MKTIFIITAILAIVVITVFLYSDVNALAAGLVKVAPEVPAAIWNVVVYTPLVVAIVLVIGLGSQL